MLDGPPCTLFFLLVLPLVVCSSFASSDTGGLLVGPPLAPKTVAAGRRRPLLFPSVRASPTSGLGAAPPLPGPVAACLSPDPSCPQLRSLNNTSSGGDIGHGSPCTVRRASLASRRGLIRPRPLGTLDGSRRRTEKGRPLQRTAQLSFPSPKKVPFLLCEGCRTVRVGADTARPVSPSRANPFPAPGQILLVRRGKAVGRLPPSPLGVRPRLRRNKPSSPRQFISE